ncbi:MAG: alpha/beta fold hydrolase [Casimicrobiaceae bacterium]
MSKSESMTVVNSASRMRYRTAAVDGVDVFYREAGPVSAATLVLLHGFPSASHQYAPLMARLADHMHVVAPDYPGFGHSGAPRSSHDGGSFDYTFDHLAEVIDAFLDAIRVNHFFVYVFDFGAPVGFRIATRHPERIRGVIAQNGNAYEAGLGPNMQSVVKHGSDRRVFNEQVKGVLSLDATRGQHLNGVRDAERVDPDTWTLDQHWMDQPGRGPIMLDLLYDYQSNVALYPRWQEWLRKSRPPVLLPWGRNDRFFPEAGARAYLADVPDAELHLLDTGHFALDDHLVEIAGLVSDFIARHSR